MNRTKDIESPDGMIVRVRPVPPLLPDAVLAKDPELQEPPMPTVEVKGVAGTEEVPARQGEAVYERWMAEVDRIEKLKQQKRHEFIWNYGVVAWKFPDVDEYESDIPDDWEIDPMLAKYNLELTRLLYIESEVLTTTGVTDEAQSVMFGNEPILDREVEAVVDSFQD